MEPQEIKIGGFGGQGVILTGMIIGKAAAIHNDMYSTLTQAFGPEARGSACSAQVIISPERILYPYVNEPNVMVVMSQEAASRFIPQMRRDKDAMLLYEEDLVNLDGIDFEAKAYGIPATRFAEEIGRKLVLNIVMVGFFTAVTQFLDADAVRTAVKESVPPGTESLNLSAFDMGFDHGKALIAN